MARSSIKKNKITKDGWEIIGNDLVEFFKQIEEEKSIEILEINRLFAESIQRGLIKFLDGGNGPDPLILVEYNPENNGVKMVHLKDVVEEVEDDFLQVQLDEIKEDYPDAVVGGQISIPYLLSDFDYPTVQALMQSFNQKIIEAEKRILFEQYKDKVDTLINGRVERVEGNNTYVNIGKTTVRLTRKDLIGNETFEPKDEIKLYVDKVSATTKGAQIEVSRSHPGFIRKLFEEEIPEVYEKAVLVKTDEPANGIFGVVREPGYRAKVAVYTNIPNLDPVSACIGPNGSRIQKIVAYLGKGKYRENVDVIQYNKNISLFIADALKPAQISGIVLNETFKGAVVVVPNDQVSIAIGVRGSNIRLAQQMTGYNLKILTETESIDQQISYIPLGEIAVDDRRQTELLKQVEIQQKRQQHIDAMSKLNDDTTVEIEDKYVDDAVDQVDVIEPIIDEVPVSQPEVKVVPEIEEVIVVEKKKEPIITVTTTTLDELEKQLEKEKAVKPVAIKKKFKKEVKKDEKISGGETKNYQKLDIVYSDEELEDAEELFVEDLGEELDLEDFEDYYDEE